MANLNPAVALARQSRTRDDSLSIAEQLERVEANSTREGYEVVASYTEEDVSGKRALDRRPGLARALADIEAGRATVLVVAYFDRLFRSLKTQAEVLERVEAAGGRVVTLDMGEISNGTAASWLSATAVGMMAEYWSRSTAERSHAAKQRLIDDGVPPFPRIPPMYRKREDGRLEQDPVRAPIVREAINMRLAGASYRELAMWLTERGVPLQPAGVEQLFRSRLLVGELHFGSFTPNLHAVDEPLLDRATFRRLQGAKASRGRRAKSERLLARLGVLRCARCDSRMCVYTITPNRPGRPVYTYYRCGDATCDERATVPAAKAEAEVVAEAIRLSAAQAGRASAADKLEAARLAALEANERLTAAIETLRGVEAEPVTRDILDELQAKRDEAVAAHERLLAVTRPDKVVRTAADWERLTMTEQRGVIVAVIERAVVTRGAAGIDIEGRQVLAE